MPLMQSSGRDGVLLVGEVSMLSLTHGYVVTSHASQGKTVDNADNTRLPSPALSPDLLSLVGE